MVFATSSGTSRDRPAPEQGVDDHVARPRRVGRKRHDLAVESLEGQFGVAFQGGGLAKSVDHDRSACLLQGACADVTVAAIVAWAAEHGEPQGTGETAKCRCRDGLPGPLHQAVAREARGGRGLVDLAHIRGRDDERVDFLVHAATMPAKTQSRQAR
jgi:hypothetical protein